MPPDHGGRGHRPDRRRPGRAGAHRAGHPTQRLPRPALRHPRRDARAVHPEAAPGLVLSELPRAAHALGAGPGRRRHGVLRQRRVDTEGRARRRAARDRRDVKVRRLADVRSPRRAGHGVPRAPAGGPPPLPVARRQGREGARPRRARAQKGPRRRLRGPRGWLPRGDRPGCRGDRVGCLLARVPALAGGARADRRRAGRIRSARGSQGRHRPDPRLPLAALHGPLFSGRCSATSTAASRG